MDDLHAIERIQLLHIAFYHTLPFSFRKICAPNSLPLLLTTAQELLHFNSIHRLFFINGILQLSQQMSMTQLMRSCCCIVLRTPIIMTEHTLVVFREMLFDHHIPTRRLNHKIGRLRRLPDPLPKELTCYMGPSFI